MMPVELKWVMTSSILHVSGIENLDEENRAGTVLLGIACAPADDAQQYR